MIQTSCYTQRCNEPWYRDTRYRRCQPVTVCSAIYARLLLLNGDYSCQLVFARSKLVQESVAILRAELLGALLNANTGHSEIVLW